MPLESAIVKSIITALRKIPYSVVWKNHGGPYTRVGVPDISFFVSGWAFFFEVKQPGKRLSAIQADMIRRLERAGAIVAVVHSTKEAMAFLRIYLYD